MTTDEPPGRDRPDRLLVDELTDQLEQTRRLLLGRADEAFERAVERTREDATVEMRLTAALADWRALAAPERFEDAHRLAIHALEVLDSSGASRPPVPRLGPLSGLLRPAVAFVISYITRSFAASVASSMATLYARREAQTAPGSPERTLLQRAREDMERVVPTFAGGGRSAPILIAAGAALPALASLSSAVDALPFRDARLWVAAIAALFVIFLAGSWIMLRGAALARRRCRLITDRPLAALWETIGRAGDPPEDSSTAIAYIAIIVPALAWFVLPALITVVFVAL